MPSFVRSGSLRANTGAYTDSPVNGLLYVRGTVGAYPQLSRSQRACSTGFRLRPMCALDCCHCLMWHSVLQSAWSQVLFTG